MPIFILSDNYEFPPPHLATEEGLLAVGGDLNPERLLQAYKSGIFPWYSKDEPIMWWSPDPRMVLYPRELVISKSMHKVLRSGKYRMTLDQAFEQVIDQCAQTRLQKKEGTWITREMMQAYCRLHEMGYAHSAETWHDNQLVGGLYGISLGRCFFGESMFALMSNASKAALVYLNDFLLRRNFAFIDCQVASGHLSSLGARNIPRKVFLAQLRRALTYPTKAGPWA